MSTFFSKENFPTLSKIPRAARWTVRKAWKPLLVIIIVLAVAHSIASFILGHRLKAELSKLKVSGVPMAMTDLGKPKVPDAENAAFIYARVFEDLTGMVLNPNGGQPKQESREKNEDMDAIEKLIRAEPDKRTPEIWDAARKAVAKHRNILPLIEAATSRPKCQFPANWEDGTNVLFPHLSPMRNTARFLHANALIEARDGKMDEAIQSIELGFKASESIRDEPILIGLLVRLVMSQSASKSLRETLEYGSITEAQAKRLYDTLAQIDMYPGLNRAMQGERCFGLWLFDLLYKHPNKLSALIDTEENEGPGRAAFRFLTPILVGIWRPILYADELTYLKIMDRQSALMRLPYREMHSQMTALAAETQHLPRHAILSRIMFPVFFRAAAVRDNAAAEAAGSQIFLALQVYKSRHGIYPATLDELRAGIGWDIPKDVFSNKDFIYKHQGNGFLLYSVGQNFKDDGAIPSSALPSQLPEGYDYKNINGQQVADIIWQMAD